MRRELQPRVRAVWDAVRAHVEGLRGESAGWTGGKQQLTATRLHELLLAEGHRVGVTLVKAAVAEWRRLRNDLREDRSPIVPLTQEQGERTDAVAQVTFEPRAAWRAYGFVQDTVATSGGRGENGWIGAGGSFVQRTASRSMRRCLTATSEPGARARAGRTHRRGRDRGTRDHPCLVAEP